MLNLTDEQSDVSRTNQLAIQDTDDDVAEKLYQYLLKRGKGIEIFPLSDIYKDGDSTADYTRRDQRIKARVKKRLIDYDQPAEAKNIQYFLAETGGGDGFVFFLSPTKHSGWKGSFTDNEKYREKIFNLVFKLHLISQFLPFETLSGFEELLLIHSQRLAPKTKDELLVWGQTVYVNFNRHKVLSLYLARKYRKFQKTYQTLGNDELGDIILSTKESTRYAYKMNLDGRHKNDINFMHFEDKEEGLEKFRKSQLYYYQKLMTELERFLDECGIAYKKRDFQADAYLEDPFVNQENLSAARALDSLAIINNTGADFTQDDMDFLRNFFRHQGIAQVQFCFSGQTVSTYEKVAGESDDDNSWMIDEAIRWESVELRQDENYLVFNKTLDEEDAGSMAFQQEENGPWTPSTDIDEEERVDFYSRLKRRYTYVATQSFYCIQGVNVKGFTALGTEDIKDTVIMRYTPKKKEKEKVVDDLLAEAQPFTEGLFLDVPASILAYLRKQTDKKAWKRFCDKYNIKVSPEFQKILIELGIKSWIRAGLIDHSLGLPIGLQKFQEQAFWSIFVISPRRGDPKGAAVSFLYRDGMIYIQEVIADVPKIKQQFKFLRTWRKKNDTGEEKLINNQQYFADEDTGIYIRCYTDPKFTPFLIGRPHLLEDVEKGIIRVNRSNKGDQASRVLPLVMYYNRDTDPVNRIQDRICLDTQKPTYIQYYVPPKMSLENRIKRGFRVYHLYGKTYPGSDLKTGDLMNNPIVALHFNTLTQNILKIGENSQSSLLQKVARVLVEN